MVEAGVETLFWDVKAKCSFPLTAVVIDELLQGAELRA